MPARRLLPLALLAAVALAGCRGEGAATAAQPKRAAAKPREVRVVPAAEERVDRVVAASGTLAAEDQVVLSLKVAGRLSQLTVDLGSRVQKGQLVARLESSDFQHRVQQAEAALQQARTRLGLAPNGTDDRIDPEQTALVRQGRAVLEEARLTRERMARLWDQQLIARAQLDAAVAALQVAEGRYQDAMEEVRTRQGVLAQRRSELDLARQQLADTVLVAPLEGAVSQRLASVGEYLGVGSPVAMVVRLHPLRLRLAIPEREAAGVRVGQVVRLSVEGQPAGATGRVARLSPAIQEQNRTLMLEAEVPNATGILRPGAFAKAEVVVEADQRVVTVPPSAIVTFAGIEKVLVVEQGKTVEKRVQTGRRTPARVEIASGLAAGELVILQPGSLTGGQAVTIVR